MTEIISALDKYHPKQFGENGHVEYGWSNGLQENILQFSFQLTRTNELGLQNLAYILRGLLTSLQFKIEHSSSESVMAKVYLSCLYRMIGHTRDIIDGKGEYNLTYMMIHTWYEFYPELAFFALKCLVDLEDKNVHQYGSWKDIKYFCEYCKSQCADVNQPLIKYAIQLLNDQLKKDMGAENKNITLWLSGFLEKNLAFLGFMSLWLAPILLNIWGLQRRMNSNKKLLKSARHSIVKYFLS